MAKYIKKPVEIEATQWFKNGDHPNDHCQAINSGQILTEGEVVRYFRSPNVDDNEKCNHCGKDMFVHGWVDTVQGGHTVCPGDWIITDDRVEDVRGHGHYYPCKPEIFKDTYYTEEEHAAL